jgi:multiple sugar transport system substrate-binding protein
VMTELTAEERPVFEAMVERWRAAHPAGPALQPLLGAAADSRPERLRTLLAAGTPPDVAALEAGEALPLTDKGQFLALDPYIKRDRYDLADFFEPAITQYQWKGKKYGLPRGMSNQSLYVNQNLFDDAGLRYPPTRLDAPGWDFDEFLKAADRLTKREGSAITQFGCTVGRALRGGYGQWVWTNGAEFFDKDFTRCTLDDPRAIEGLQFMQDLIYRHRVAPTPQEETAAGGAEAMFIAGGRVAMRIAPVAQVTRHRRATFRWDYAVNPRGKGKRLTTGGGVAWLILAESRQPEEAWAVFQHLVSLETAKQLAAVYYPGRRSAVQYLQTVDPDLPPKSRHVGADGQTVIHVNPIFPAWQEIERDLVVPELNALWRNERTAQQVIAALVPKVNDFLRTKGPAPK